MLIVGTLMYLFQYAEASAAIPTVGTGMENEQQIKITNGINSAIYVVEYVNTKIVGEMTDLREVIFTSKLKGEGSQQKWKDLTKVWQKQQKMQKGMMSLSTLSTALGTVGVLASFAFALFGESETSMLQKQMTTEFKQVNSKLDGIYAKLGSVEDSLKNFITADTDLDNLNDYINAIKDGINARNEMLGKVNDLKENYIPDTYQQEMMKAFETFKDFYEDNSIQSSINNVVRLVDLYEDRPTQKFDIFTTVRKVTYCDISELQNLHTFIETYLIQAGQLKFLYKIITEGPNSFNEKQVKNWVSTLKESFDHSFTYCLYNAPTYAKDKVLDLGSENPEEIAMELKGLFPWYDWAVGIINDKDDELVCESPYLFKASRIVSQQKGDNFFEADGPTSKILVVYQDASQGPVEVVEEGSCDDRSKLANDGDVNTNYGDGVCGEENCIKDDQKYYKDKCLLLSRELDESKLKNRRLKNDLDKEQSATIKLNA